MAKTLHNLIDSYTKYVRTGNSDGLSSLYKLPTVLKGLDGGYLCLRDQSQLSKYIESKFALLGKKTSLEYIGNIGPNFSLLKEVHHINDADNFAENGIIIKKVAGKYWIVGESDIN